MISTSEFYTLDVMTVYRVSTYRVFKVSINIHSTEHLHFVYVRTNQYNYYYSYEFIIHIVLHLGIYIGNRHLHKTVCSAQQNL